MLAELGIEKNDMIEPLLHGGAHEFNLRPSTENVPAIVGMGKALSIIRDDMQNELKREEKLRDFLIDNVLKDISDSKLNGSRKYRLANNTLLKKQVEPLFNATLSGGLANIFAACLVYFLLKDTSHSNYALWLSAGVILSSIARIIVSNHYLINKKFYLIPLVSITFACYCNDFAQLFNPIHSMQPVSFDNVLTPSI